MWLSSLVAVRVKTCRRVSGLVDLLQLADRNMCVDLCGVEPHVAEHGLNVADVRASFDHQCRHRMAEDVARAVLADHRGFHVLAM